MKERYIISHWCSSKSFGVCVELGTEDRELWLAKVDEIIKTRGIPEKHCRITRNENHTIFSYARTASEIATFLSEVPYRYTTFQNYLRGIW